MKIVEDGGCLWWWKLVMEFVRVVKWWREGCYGGEDEEKS